MKSISIVGPGRLGGALALALSAAGYIVDDLVFRTGPAEGVLPGLLPSARRVTLGEVGQISSDAIIITVPDPVIAETAGQISGLVKAGTVVLHASGALSSDILGVPAERGCHIGSMHPLVSVSDPVRGAGSFSGSFFCIEGSEQAAAAADEIVESLGGRPFRIQTEFKPLYHASAVLASGHLVALIDTAIEVLSVCGPGRSEAQEILMPLVKSAVENLSAAHPAASLTGPFARGDLDTIKNHIAAFHKAGLAEAESTYLQLGLRATQVAARLGERTGELAEIEEFIKLAQVLPK